MSGPKVSVYTLSAWARSIIAQQMRCDQDALVCVEDIRRILSELTSSRMELDKSISMLELLQKRAGGYEDKIANARSIQSKLNQDLQAVESDLRQNKPKVSTQYTVSTEALEEKQKILERVQAVKGRASSLKAEVDRVAGVGIQAGKNEQRRVQGSISEYLGGEEEESSIIHTSDILKLNETIADSLSGVSSFDIDDEPEENSFNEQKEALRSKLEGYLRLELPGELVSEIEVALEKLSKINEKSYLTSFNSVTVQRITKDIAAYRAESEKKKTIYMGQLERYKTLCTMAGLEIRDNIKEEELEEEIQRIELTLIKQQEQQYISECVDEVMSDMGYDLIGRRDVKKKSGKRFKNELYEFGEGTAVNVTYSPEGQISMELGGIAREDRLPSPEETEILTQDMETFCGEFAEFEKRMKEKGVIVGNRIALMPPTAEHAAIINVSDYDVADGKQVSEMQVSIRKKKAAEKKVLRRNN